jgi:hypothetical protein
VLVLCRVVTWIYVPVYSAMGFRLHPSRPINLPIENMYRDQRFFWKKKAGLWWELLSKSMIVFNNDHLERHEKSIICWKDVGSGICGNNKNKIFFFLRVSCINYKIITGKICKSKFIWLLLTLIEFTLHPKLLTQGLRVW